MIAFIILPASPVFAGDDSWQIPLSRMPLTVPVRELNRTNCVEVMLPSFQSNNVVKALIFMPGATDEFYMFHRAHALLTNAQPTLLDAVNALASQTYIQVTFRAPFLLLHTDEDALEPAFVVNDAPTEEKIRQARFVPQALYNDRDWDFLLPILKKTYRLKFLPEPHNIGSWHFYRHSFAAWDLSGWEGLEAIALAGKSTFTVEKKRVVFEGDERVRGTPKF